MTREYREYAKSRIEYLLKISSFVFDERDKEALEAAIKALSQEPCDDTMSREAEIKKLIEQPAKVYIDKTDYQRGYIDGVNQMGKELKAERQKPIECDDVVSREAVKELIKCGVSTDTYDDVEQVCKWIDALPTVTQKSGKWDRLYSWLNDMRLGIAPDETVTDIDERSCRESQTDILDEIMEWMIKAESEDKE